MPVAVQGRQNIPKEDDPLDRIIKGLQIAHSVYGIASAGEKAKELLAEKEAKKKQQDFDNQVKLVSGGLKQEGGLVVPDENNPFFDKKTREQTNPLADAIKTLQIKELERKSEEMGLTQSKQAGNYKLGMLAEQQYLEATKDPKVYDPTSIDSGLKNAVSPYPLRDEKAKAAENAQSSWVEVFLRDASGAAIPPSERMNYAKDYFPRFGDSPEVVANKAALRQQKMENARTSAGSKFTDLSPQPQQRMINGKPHKRVPGGWEEI